MFIKVLKISYCEIVMLLLFIKKSPKILHKDRIDQY